MPLLNGQILQSRYRILRPLGQGGMGAVYLADHTQLAGRRFAIKENVPDPSAGAQALAERRQQFNMEAQVLASLDHPHLPKVSDFFTEGGNEYLVMDYVEGQNLEEALQQHLRQQGKPLPEKPVLIWADQVLDALEYLHGQRPRPIIHRDIKPANIVLTPQGKAKLVDFGLVKLYDPSKPGTATVIQGMGTPEYTPLEQYGGGIQHTDARSDIYALGATLYHLLTGAAPPLVRDRLLDPTKLAPPRRLNPALSVGTEAAILRALEIHPDQRFQTAREMRRALAGTGPAIAPPTVPVQPPARPATLGGRSNWRPWAGVAGLVVLLLAILAFRPGGLLDRQTHADADHHGGSRCCDTRAALLQRSARRHRVCADISSQPHCNVDAGPNGFEHSFCNADAGPNGFEHSFCNADAGPNSFEHPFCNADAGSYSFEHSLRNAGTVYAVGPRSRSHGGAARADSHGRLRHHRGVDADAELAHRP